MEPRQKEKLEQAYGQFIEFGQLMDRRMRTYLVRYLERKLGRTEMELPELRDQYFQYFRAALDRLLGPTGLLRLIREHHQMQVQVVVDLLRWLRKKSEKNLSGHPFQDEQQRLEGWSVTPLHVFHKRWPFLINYLSQRYRREDLDTAYYQSVFEKRLGHSSLEELTKAEREQVELRFTDLLAQWDALLHAQILDYQLRKLEEETDAYAELLEAKVEEYKQLSSLISPFSEYLGWDLSRKLWQDTSFDALEQYHELLEDEESIKALADMLGKLREAEIEMEEETLEKTIIRQEWVNDPMARTEVQGVHESDDLHAMLSSEAALLSEPATEGLFLKRFADKGLLTLRYEDRYLQKSEHQFSEIHRRVRQKEKGPFIVCVDTSESMMGRPEEIAKVCTLAILRMAMRENRQAYLINFSRGVETLDLYDIAGSMDALAKFLRMSFYGGTDISLALHEAFRQIRSERYQDADVLVVSDFIMYRLDRRILEEVNYFQHNQGTRFHSLIIGDQGNSELIRAFDTNWEYEPGQKGIIRALHDRLQSISS